MSKRKLVTKEPHINLQNVSVEKLAEIIKDAAKSSEKKQKIELKKIQGWLNEIKMKHALISKEQKPPQAEFALTVGDRLQVILYTPKVIPDRLNFQGQFNFSEQHRQETKKMSQEKFSEFIFKLTDRMTSYGVDWNFNIDGQQINNLTHNTFIYNHELTKNQFLQKLNRTQVIHSQILRTISFLLGIKSSEASSSSESSIYG